MRRRVRLAGRKSGRRFRLLFTGGGDACQLAAQLRKTQRFEQQRIRPQVFAGARELAVGCRRVNDHRQVRIAPGIPRADGPQHFQPACAGQARIQNDHADKTPEYLRGRVEYTQKKTYEQLLKAQEISVKAHEAVRLANAYEGKRAPDYEALMTEAREMVRKGQLFWDYVSAENSVGFHNPAKTLDTLMSP